MKIINNYFNNIFTDNLNDFDLVSIDNNMNEIYNNSINEYLSNYKYFSNIKNINKDFIDNVTNIKLYKEYNNYLLLSCLYNNKNAIIKVFYNPYSNFDLLYEQMIYSVIESKSNKYDFIPKIYNLGFIDFNILFNDKVINEFLEYMNTIYDNEISDYDMNNLFKKSFHNLINDPDNEDIDTNFINYYKFSKNFKNKYICNLLLFFKNKKMKNIHITIIEDYINNNINLLDFYKNNIINSDSDNVTFNNDIFLIIYNILKNINILNNEINIIHHNICLENIFLIPDETMKYKCLIINYNFSYMKNINNLSLFKYYNLGIKNNLNNMIDDYIFLTSFINNSFNDIIPKPFNFFTYNKNNFKILNKIIFKKNKKLRELCFKNHIFFINKINIFFCDNIIFNDICNNLIIDNFNFNFKYYEKYIKLNY